MQYKHFSVEEREEIQQALWKKRSIRWIAQNLRRSPSSVAREVKRNNPMVPTRYTPRRAHDRALKQRKSRGRKDRLKNQKVRTYVIMRLKGGWSPEQISGCIKADIQETISHEAIYQYIFAQVHRDGWGLLRPGSEDLRPYLRRKRKRRQKQGLRRSQRVLNPHGRSIEERPGIVSERRRVGDWESDTVESRDHRPGVNTLLERKTGLFLVTKVRDKTGAATTAVILQRMAAIPQSAKHTMTFDNGSENSAWRTLEEQAGIATYFAHPYHSWERGSNENANGLLREYFPKGTDFSTIPDEEIARVEYLLNTRPRKRLGWKTPLEAFSVALRG